MNPVTGAAITAYYSVTDTVGDSDGYCLVTANPVDKVDVFYRISYHLVGTPVGTYLFHSDLPWERWFFGVKVKIAKLATNGVVADPPTRLVDTIKIETININNEADRATVTVTTPTNLTQTQETPHDFTFVTAGDIGDLHGAVTLRWQDLSKFISGGRIKLTKYGVTSLGTQQTLFDASFSGYPFTFSDDYSSPNFIQIPFLLLPPGIILPDPPVWSTNPPPSPDRDAPLWVVEGDVLTLTLTTVCNQLLAGPGTVLATFNFHYRHSARFYQFADSATIHQPYSKQLEIIQDPWVPIPIQGTFALGGSTPALPGVWNLTPGGLLTCTNPTSVGFFTVTVRLTSLGNSVSAEPINLRINIAGKPVIMAPPQTLPLILGSPYPPAYNFYATNHPVHWSFSGGSLPSGLSLNAATGEITGTPDTPTTTPINLTFLATNAVPLVSDPYITQWTVSSFSPPNITSASEVTVYLEEATPYQIVTDVPAINYRAFDLPSGLKLLGSVLAGIPTALPGDYTVSLQAANRWGWGPLFPLVIHVRVSPPEIISPLQVSAEIGSEFLYPIVATHSPDSYAASGLPPDLSVNEHSGEISGIPIVTVGSSTAGSPVGLQAINAGGTGTAVLMLTIFLPPVPVIDTTATHGRAITADTVNPVTLTVVASHNPTSWAASPVPDGLTLATIPDEHGGGTSARLSGIFQAGGLYAVSFVATNRGGNSDPAIFYFLVTLSAGQAQEINQLGTIMEIWIDLNTAAVGIGNTSTIEQEHVVVPTGTVLTLKRGDTIDLHIIFHEEGVPVNVNLTSLKFGIKEAFDDEFIIFTDMFSVIGGAGGAGRFRINPDFSGTNDDLDAVLVDATTSLKAEIQWEMLGDTGANIRRSSQIFDVAVLRDLIHPD